MLEGKCRHSPHFYKIVRTALKANGLVFAPMQKSEQRVRKLMKTQDVLFEERYRLGLDQRSHGQWEQMRSRTHPGGPS